MKKRFFLSCFIIFLSLNNYAFVTGQKIQIITQLHSFIGKPNWLIIIRDIDHNKNIPYLYSFSQGSNDWMIFTNTRNYLILSSELAFSPYRSNPYQTRTIKNFCHLESQGRIISGQSLRIQLRGFLSLDLKNYHCSINRYQDGPSGFKVK